MLSGSSDSDSEDIHTLAINEHFAKALEYKKEREALSKPREKYGSDFENEDEEDSEEAESEDEDGEELTPAVDAAILRTLAKIKRKDPEIYEAQKNIYEDERSRTVSSNERTRRQKDKSKPITMRQVALESAIHATSRSASPSLEVLPHIEEQHALRSETIAAFHGAASDDDDKSEDNLFIAREKTKDQMEQEEEEYRDFLAREVGEDLQNLLTLEKDAIGAREKELVEESAGEEQGEDQGKKKKKKKKKKKVAAKQETDQEFLMNYILNRGWIDRSAKRIPTYGEIIQSSHIPDTQPSGSEGNETSFTKLDVRSSEAFDEHSDDGEFEEIVERFETSYNFRFEEPDAAVIKGYPRNLPSLVRREDTTRKDARERKKQRKEEELLKKREEVKRLKGLKLKELRAKLERIGREGGKDVEHDAALQELDLDGDWDPDAHDQQMAGLYGDDDLDADDKPQWEEDIDIDDIVSDEDMAPPTKQTKTEKKKKKKKVSEDEEGLGVDVDAMDADIQRDHGEDEEWDGTEEMRKRKLDEYMEEMYRLDFNDMVGDMPTRFKYTTVQPESFALTPAEILTATDAELNQYMSVKKYAPYRKDNRWDKTRVDRLKDLKQTVAERSKGAYGIGGELNDGHRDVPPKKRKGKKERQKMKAVDSGEGAKDKGDEARGQESTPKDSTDGKRKRETDSDPEDVKNPPKSGKRRRKRRKTATRES